MRIFCAALATALLGACSSGLTYKDAPAGRMSAQGAMQLRGAAFRPGKAADGLYFTALAARGAYGVRLVVLGDMGVKLLDIQVTAGGAEVYYKMNKIPSALAGAFARMARAELLGDAPSKVTYRDPRTRLIFEADVLGGKE